MEKIKIGIIGTGMTGKAHIESIRYIDEFEITALCDTNEDSLNSAVKLLGHEVQSYRDYREMLEKAPLDVVSIATPNHTHKEITIEALKTGKHVRCEKPMAITMEECYEVMNAVERYNRILDIGLELRYSPLYKKIKDIIAKDEIGTPRIAWVKEFRPPFLKKVDDWILYKSKSGGTILEKNCHHFDLFYWYLDSLPKCVCAFGGSDSVYRDRDILDNACIITEYENGARSMLGLCMFAPNVKPDVPNYGNDLEIGIIGDKGKLEALDPKNEISVWMNSNIEKQIYSFHPGDAILKMLHGGSIYYSFLAFLDCIKESKKTVTNETIGLYSTAMSLAAQKSVEEKRIVYLEEMLNR